MVVQPFPPPVTIADRRDRGRQASRQTPPTVHADWTAAADRPDPVELLVAQNVTRESDLVPVRHGRMMTSPLAFYRGAAAVMAADLAHTPTADLQVQLCGDAHLSNFGGYASPERHLVFGVNDFDETLPGPFEYDLLRLAASFTIAARSNQFRPRDVRDVTGAVVRAYRTAMIDFADQRTLDVWYARIDESDIRAAMRSLRRRPAGVVEGSAPGKKGRRGKPEGRHKTRGTHLDKAIKATHKLLRKARTRDHLHALARFTEVVDGRPRITSNPPVVTPLRELDGAWGLSGDEIRAVVQDQFEAYQSSLSADRRQLVASYRIVDVARKVVGVGSVGTRAFMVLLQGRDEQDPLFLQVKEATRSVLEQRLPATRFATPGQRVVEGQRLMQSSSDIFLGWTNGMAEDRFYYWRQLRDMKVSAVVETMDPLRMNFYARLCGWTLAHAHARSGDPVAIAAYLGQDDDLDRALVEFSARYAAQNADDHRRFVAAISDGRVEALQDV